MGLILLYHQVGDQESDPWSLAVSLANFRHQIEVLRSEVDIVPLRQLFGQTNCKSRRPRVALTFDDGYIDNFTAVRPLLEEHDVPATFFVVTGAIGSGREFWWDELEQILLRSNCFDRTLDIVIQGQRMQWDLNVDKDFHEMCAAANARWQFVDPEDTTPHQRCYRKLYSLIRLLPPASQTEMLDCIAISLRVRPQTRHNKLPLSHDQLTVLANGQLFDIGSHTTRHLFLPALSPQFQAIDTFESKNTLEEYVGRPVASFAYPYGRKTECTIGVVQQLGFQIACQVGGECAPASSPLALPRWQIHDLEAMEFRKQLHRRLYDICAGSL
jgi:peptidoglycan/xylan/chitin deacetylase (PgdA/CDA1 family)